MLCDHDHRSAGDRALGVQVGKVFGPAAAEDTRQVRRAPLGQPTPREAPRARPGRDGIVGEQAGVVPKLGWETGWEGPKVAVDTGGGLCGVLAAYLARRELLE